MRGETVERFLFSVILPVYQVESYLDECLSSLQPQCGDDVQILLIDDGSTDGSLRILREWEQRCPNIEVISQPNQGVSGARNAGLDRARGEYILWVDPDDWVMPDWLAAIRQRLAQTNPDMLVFDYIACDGDRRQECRYGRPAGPVEPRRLIHDLTEDTRLTSVLWNKVIHRSFFIGPRFDENLRCMEDAELLTRITPKMQRIDYLPNPLYCYRIRPGGLVQTPDLSTALRCWQLALDREEQLREQGFPASSIGGWRQAKGFLCKYYRAGMPDDFREAFEQVRGWLNQSLPGCLKNKTLSLLEKLKFLLIGSPLVGKGYALMKKLRTRNGG